MSSVHRTRIVRVASLCSIIAIAACGGSTDIDFTGEDAGATGGSSNAGSSGTGTGASAGSAGSGGSPTGGSGGGVPTGGASGSGGSTGGAGNVGGGGGSGPVVCGGVTCDPPSLPIGQADSCCVGDKCGITSSMIGGQCVELNQPGTPDPTCPEQSIQGFNLPGCCKDTGFCGVMDTFLGLGCVDPGQFTSQPPIPCGGGTGGAGGVSGSGGTGGSTGGAGGSTGGAGGGTSTPGEKNCGITNPDVCTTGETCCVLDPGLDYCSAQPCACTQPNCDITVVSCDGPEDCPGQICCGTYSFQQQQYTTLACKSSCSAQNEREICHPGGTCTNPNQTCSNSPSLPSYLHRCD